MDAVWLALGAPRRRQILSFLRGRERSAGEIHRAAGDLTFGAVSQHLGVLERAGLLSVRREGRSRLYAARPAGLAPLRAWLATMWDDALAALAAHAEAEEAGSRDARAGDRQTRSPARDRRRRAAGRSPRRPGKRRKQP